jgi:uncharacterized protein (TIGR03083 family)
VQTSPGPWISALRNSHDRLRATVEPLDDNQVQGKSYAAEWSIAQVLSHLGSQAEIFDLFLTAALTGGDPPGRDDFGPIWDRWNGKSPQAQVADALRADGAVTERLESLDPAEQDRLRLDMFGQRVDVAGLARMRLGELAVHSWDVAVAVDPQATVAQDAVDLLIDTIGQVAARVGKPGEKRRMLVTTTSPDRQLILDIGDAVSLTPAAGDEALPELILPSEALIRLVYGRLDAAHTPPVRADGVDLDELRAVFPGV